ncbi:MAG: serine/threonine-protein phosphatase [Phycisphaerales bacterium]|nr:serine/threonine-protein phosphatase [Phycisphaerales bacterium]
MTDRAGPASGPPPADPFLADRDFLARFERQRARVLRRRIEWYCILVLLLTLLSAFGTFMEMQETPAPDSAGIQTWKYDLPYDIALTLLFGALLLYAAAWRPGRTGLVTALTANTALAAVVAMPLEIATGDLTSDYLGIGIRADNRATILAFGAMAVFIVFQGLASLLVPMRARESLRMILPALVAYAITIAAMLAVPPARWLGFVTLFALASLPGLFWSRWRYREFDERFRSGEMRGKLGELTAELSYARQIHEALFPPALERGPVRVTYRYEPMREIGGDFLFIAPLAFPPSQPDGPVHIVLIDVSGHGVPAALAVNRLHGELQRFFTRTLADGVEPALSPAQLLERLNHFGFNSLSPQGVYATALAIRIDPAAGLLEYASAGHPPAFLRDAAGRTHTLEATETMLGILPPDAFNPAPATHPFTRGDRLAAFTDGTFEAQDAAGEELGLPRLRQVIEQARAGNPGDLAAAVLSAVAAHRHGPARDDVLIVEVARAD